MNCHDIMLYVCLSMLYIFSGSMGVQNISALRGDKTMLHVGGFFTFDETVPVTAVMPEVAQRAIDHINNLPFLLHDYELRLRWGFTKVSLS